MIRAKLLELISTFSSEYPEYRDLLVRMNEVYAIIRSGGEAEAVEAGVLPAVIPLLFHDHDTIRWRAAEMVQWLAGNGQAEAVRKAGAIPELAKAIAAAREHDRKRDSAARNAVYALRYLAEAGEGLDIIGKEAVPALVGHLHFQEPVALVATDRRELGDTVFTIRLVEKERWARSVVENGGLEYLKKHLTARDGFTVDGAALILGAMVDDDASVAMDVEASSCYKTLRTCETWFCDHGRIPYPKADESVPAAIEKVERALEKGLEKEEGVEKNM